ncbi:hypothetical protein BLNAU_7122 [Blattamonas nauphoetae]|uniref:Uncharacterized protein n=1 Tax=Blattamonas nauphoetae TaxID=2049346 RepID=A0ABQ9Y2H2_9EUKA|nr:hypothetical protein BLNAU_7122 [Blattamonas nauphoetae]
MDCYPFVNWDEEELRSEQEKAAVFRSLVATLKLQPTLDVSLEAQAAKFLKSVHPASGTSADAFLSNFASPPDLSLTDFVQSIIVLVSSSSQIIITSAMEILTDLLTNCSTLNTLALVKADLIPELISTLNPLSLSFTESVDIHTVLLSIITGTLWISTPIGMEQLEMEVGNEQQTFHETIMRKVLVPSEKYISHLCMNRFSIVDYEISGELMELLARLLVISASNQPAMDFVLNMPVVLMIPSYLTFFEPDNSIWYFLNLMVDMLQEWYITSGEVRLMWTKVYQMLRMEGIEDVVEAKLPNDNNTFFGRWIIINSIDLKNLLGFNVPQRE